MARIVYITKDKERAEAISESNDYSIYSGDGTRDTLELMREYESDGSPILVFKNNTQIEKLAKEKGLKLLNPSAEVAEKIENKITQVEWLGDLGNLLPPHSIQTTESIVWNKKPFILQWAHSHTGEGTFLVQNEEILNSLKKDFPKRDAKVTDFIKGPMFTANVVVTPKETLIGNISYQITGILPFTENPWSTVGNDWSIPHSILTPENIEEIKNIALKIADKMRSSGWKGLFGIDVIYDEERNSIYLIEINARQPASTTFESKLQSKMRESGINGITTFEAHLLALTDKSITEKIIEINDGAQIVQRVTGRSSNINKEDIAKAGYNVIEYKNTKLNLDQLRIQSDKGIMETHNKFNKRGKEILDIVSK